jgi:transcriptional regulator with XRE-family HTH domain
MHISEYMRVRNLTDREMAELIGAERSYVTRLRLGQAKPSPAMTQTIFDRTEGAIEPNDWYDLGQAGSEAELDAA